MCDGAEKRAYPHSLQDRFCINLARAEVPLHAGIAIEESVLE